MKLTISILTNTFLSLSILILLANCNEPGNVPIPPEPGAIGSACTSSDDCGSRWCYTDVSFPGGHCMADCAAAGICEEGAACHTYLGNQWCLHSCVGDEECRDQYVCDYGVCRPQCDRAEACQNGNVCVQGRCKSACVSDGDCPNGQRCQDGKCLPPCAQDTDCLPGYVCNTGSGNCDPKPGKMMGEACGSDSECATEYCLPTRRICSILCTGSGGCPSEYVCGLEKLDDNGSGTFEGAEADCVPRVGGGVAGSLCDSDGVCASNHCYNGFCMEGCETDNDCGSLQCVSVKIVLESGFPVYKGCLPRTGHSTVNFGTYNSGQYIGIDIPPNASSFVIETEVSSTVDVGLVGELKDPNGSVLYQPTDECDYYGLPIRYAYAEQLSSLYVPNTSSVSLVPGIHSVLIMSTKQTLPVTVKMHLKLGTAQKGTLNLNWFFLNLSDTCIPTPLLNASSASTHIWFQTLAGNLKTLLKTAGLTVGTETFQDLNVPNLDIINMSMVGGSTELQQLFASSGSMSGDAMNVFFVRKIESGEPDAMILGIAGGIPGPVGTHGKVHSGVAMSMETACLEPFGYNPADTLAHEMGHYLGLFHNQEQRTNPGYDMQSKQVVCPCPCGANMTCEYDVYDDWCRGLDHIPDTDASLQNLMYFAAESTQQFEGNQLTAGQIRVILDNPLVGH